MSALSPTHVILFSLAMFGIGVVGVLTRRNAILILMSIELILNAANLNFIAFAWALPDVAGDASSAGSSSAVIVTDNNKIIEIFAFGERGLYLTFHIK